MAISGKQSWIESSEVVSLFPTLVWKIQLRAEVHEPIDASALGLLHSLRQGQPELKSGEAWQSGHALHRREEVHALCDCVNRAAASVLQFLKIGESAIEITGCWMNLYAPGAAHRAHSHPNNFLSAVYYVRTRPGADSINFHDPRSQAGVIRPPVTELTAANTDQVVVRVKDGTLVCCSMGINIPSPYAPRRGATEWPRRLIRLSVSRCRSSEERGMNSRDAEPGAGVLVGGNPSFSWGQKCFKYAQRPPGRLDPPAYLPGRLEDHLPNEKKGG